MPAKECRLAIIGSYGNGKSSLSTKLCESLRVPVVHASPMSMSIGPRFVDLSNCNNVELVQLPLRRYTERLIAESKAGPCFISDGSLMHEWFYLSTRLRYGTHPTTISESVSIDDNGLMNFVIYCMRIAVDYAKETYTHIFLLRNDVPLADSPSPISEAFRDRLDLTYKQELEASDVKFFELGGPMEQRVSRALQCLETI